MTTETTMTVEALLEMLRNNKEAFNRFRDEHRDFRIDFSGRDLSGWNLRKADLSEISFKGANLRDADISNSKVTRTNFTDADLSGANLTGTNLHMSVFRNARFRGAKMGPFSGNSRMCVNVSTFEDAHFDKEVIERVLELINLNADWAVKYEIVPKAQK